MDYSIEALIAEGTGLKTRDEMRYTSSSESAYDGYFDAVQAELTRSFENLEFLDTYSRVNEANDASKLRMMKRLKRVYGTTIDDPIKASSVESFIDRNIRSIEEDKKTDGGDKKPSKVKEFFGKIIEALKTMLHNLKEFFKGIWKKLKEFFTRKNENNSRVATEEEIKKIIIAQPNVGIKDVDHNKYNKTNTNVDASGAGDWLVKFDKIQKDKAKKAIDGIISIKDVAAVTSALKGIGSINERLHNERLQASDDEDGLAIMSAGHSSNKRAGKIDKVASLMDKSKLINQMNDTDIAKTYFNAEKCDAKYVSKLSVKAIVNMIRNMSDLENVSTKIESVVEKGIKGVEDYYKSGSGGALNSSGMSGGEKTKTDNLFKETCTMLRDAAKASQKVTSVGVKIATVAYKCLVPKTDQQKADYNSSVAAKEYEKKFNKTA